MGLFHQSHQAHANGHPASPQTRLQDQLTGRLRKFLKGTNVNLLLMVKIAAFRLPVTHVHAIKRDNARKIEESEIFHSHSGGLCSSSSPLVINKINQEKEGMSLLPPLEIELAAAR